MMIAAVGVWLLFRYLVPKTIFMPHFYSSVYRTADFQTVGGSVLLLLVFHVLINGVVLA